MRLHDLATPKRFYFQIIYGPKNVGCILGNVEYGKGNLLWKLLLLSVSNNCVTFSLHLHLHLVSCGPENCCKF